MKFPICFHSLIYGIVISHHPGILQPFYSVNKRESLLTLHYKLFSGEHVQDIVGTSFQAPGPETFKARTIAHLKDTYRELDAIIKTSSASVIRWERTDCFWNVGLRFAFVFAKCRGKQESPLSFILSNKERKKAQKNSFFKMFLGSGG